MGMFDHFPYTNFHELNLDWILQVLKEIEKTMDQFVAINALKYADPIQWNIVSQYEKNTIVIDPLTGTAYISVQPVPSGVALTNTDYWTIVFDLGAFVVRAAKNFTNRWESETTLTATFSTPVGSWLVWGDTLYKALVNITAGDTYVIDSNIQHFTIEELKNEIIAAYQLADENIRGSITYNALTHDTATRNIAEGTLIYWHDNLYRTTANIAEGEAFSTQTNLTLTRVGDFIIWVADNISDAFHLADENIRGSIAYNALNNDTATRNIAEGVLVYWHDNLYRTTTNIAEGETFSTETNLTPTRVGDYILWLTTNISNAFHLADENIRGSIATNELSSPTATVHSDKNTLLWWHDNLYETLTDIEIGDSYAIGTNIESRSINDFIINQIAALLAQINTILDVTNASAAPKYLTVGNFGCNFTTINAAVNFAKTYATSSNRVTIIVIGGYYNESINLVNNPGIDLYGINHPTIRSNVDYPEGAINFSGNMRIHGFILLNTKADSNSYAIHYEAQQSPDRVSNNIHISDCDIASWGNAGIGAGLASGDVFEVENCRITSFHTGSPALLTHPYPLATETQASEYYRECTFKCLGDYAIIVHNSRAMQGNTGESKMLFRCIGCLADNGHNKIKYTYDANNSQGYIPRTGEIHLEADCVGNNMPGVNYESAGEILHQYRLAMPSRYNWTDGSNYRRYSNGIEFKNKDLYTITLNQCASMDGTSFTSRSNIDSGLPNNIGVNIMDDLNDTYKDAIQAGVIVRVYATPAL